ncbi:MAG: SusC/RagA family TonB-linked outer membrane protein, partial [Odoribacter splanchnicus]|nr:SusC/RagA family TonB-linked outer membrane protein [Odoribacter splanchnicus]
MYFKILLLCLTLLPLGASAQNVLRGVVKDNTGSLIGATVCIVNNDGRVLSGVVTNENGEYSLPVPDVKDIKIEFSFVGYNSQRVTYKQQKVLNITLQETATALDEVVVSAKAIERNNMGVATKDLGIAQQKIDLEEYQDMPVTSVEDMLQGKLANVDIVSASGDPGSRSSIRIRGTSSLNASNEPLIVIDDIPYETEINEDFQFESATDEDLGALVNIAPSDIASITVLKDAAATAIWGSRAAGGVLLITTKKGTKGKPRFSITQKFNFKKEPKGVPMLNAEQYVTLMQDGIWNMVRDNNFSHAGDYSQYLDKYPDIRFDPTYQWYNEFNQNTDWLDLVTKNAFTSETNFSMSGGGDRATYRFSAGYLSEGGTTIGTGLKRVTTRLNVDYNFSKKLRVSAAFSYAESNKDANYRDDVRAHARNKMPNMSPYVLDENGNMTDEYFTNPITDPCIQGTWANGKQYNPVAMAKESINNTISRSMRVSFNLRYQILSSLLLTEDIAFDLGSTKNKKFLPNSAIGVKWTDSDYNNGSDNMSDNITVTTNTKLIFTKTFNELHKVVFTGMAQTRDYNYASYSSAMSGFGSSEVADPTAGGKITSLNSGTSQNRSVGFLANGHYNYADRYMITAGVRYDGNSKMGKNSRWGAFPSVSLAWRISNERFLLEKEWIDEIKLRGSWGKSGTSPSGNYTYIGKFSSNGNYMDMSAIRPESIQLNNLKWETVTQLNGGLDINLFQGKLGIVLEYYKKTTDDLLQTSVPIQSTSGFSSIGYFNSGKVENRGWEIMIDLKDIVKIGDFTFG